MYLAFFLLQGYKEVINSLAKSYKMYERKNNKKKINNFNRLDQILGKFLFSLTQHICNKMFVFSSSHVFKR